MTTRAFVRSTPGATGSRRHPAAPRLRLVGVPVRCGTAAMPRPLATAPERPAVLSAGRALMPRQPGAQRLRLTRRGRVVLGSGLLVLAFIAFGLGRVSAGAAVVAGNHTVTVSSGDTLWSIASRAAPNADPRAEVAGLQAVNHLSDGAALEPGQILFLPTGS